MTYRLYLQTSAVRDLRTAYDWYEEQKPGLGKEFLAAVDVVLTQIELYPLLFAIIYRQKHRALVSRFPYNVSYAVEGDLIRVSAIIHGKQNPKKWTKRK